ncbi:hypothetical protein [Frigoriglobus tundricola]|uniref:Uncharacterized protein n=1 Tax=Frigoriglobus tundricola TaxID=2774151 RepID=A0A6M5Z702_9BACT|nr:hypothetical protein [Frigoriglobus tundricola]QJX01164.1 hypothetical protein FTUN_8803 [Frigoriglobus tundricola]
MAGIMSLTRDQIAKLYAQDGDDGPALGVQFCFDWSGTFMHNASKQFKAFLELSARAGADPDLAAALWVCVTYMSGFVRGTGYQRVTAPFKDNQLPPGGGSPHCEMSDLAREQNLKFLDDHPGSLLVDVWFADGLTPEGPEVQEAAIARYRQMQSEKGTHCLVVALSESVNWDFLKKLSVHHEVVHCHDDNFAGLFELILGLLKGLAKNPKAIDGVKSLDRTEIAKLMNVSGAPAVLADDTN